MATRIELTESELQRMKRILAYQNLSNQRGLAIPFFVLAIGSLVITPIIAGFDPKTLIVSWCFAMVAYFIGMARLGYYKLFRIIQYLGQSAENRN